MTTILVARWKNLPATSSWEHHWFSITIYGNTPSNVLNIAQNAANQLQSEDLSKCKINKLLERLHPWLMQFEFQHGVVTEASEATSQTGYLKYVHDRLKPNASHTNETNKENIAPTPCKSESVICLEALAKEMSTSGPTKKKKVTKSNLTLLGPKDGQPYGKCKAYTILQSHHPEWKSEWCWQDRQSTQY
jgi:hypothetical protein